RYGTPSNSCSSWQSPGSIALSRISSTHLPLRQRTIRNGSPFSLGREARVITPMPSCPARKNCLEPRHDAFKAFSGVLMEQHVTGSLDLGQFSSLQLKTSKGPGGVFDRNHRIIGARQNQNRRQEL